MQFGKLMNKQGVPIPYPELIACDGVTYNNATGTAMVWDADGGLLAEMTCARVAWIEAGGMRMEGVEQVGPNEFRAMAWQIKLEG